MGDFDPKYRGRMGPYMAYLMQGPNVGTVDNRTPIDDNVSWQYVKIFPSVSPYDLGGVGDTLRTSEDYEKCLRHVVVTMGGFGMHMPLKSFSIELVRCCPGAVQALSNISYSKDRHGAVTRMANRIKIEAGWSPGVATFMLGHEVMHLWLVVNGIEPEDINFMEAVCNAMGLLVFVSISRRYQMSHNGRSHPKFNDNLQFCYRQVQTELQKVRQCDRDTFISDFVMNFIEYCPEPLIRSVPVCMYKVLRGFRV